MMISFKICGKDTTFDETDNTMESATRALACLADFSVSLQQNNGNEERD
jgi:hypothetical protein